MGGVDAARALAQRAAATFHAYVWNESTRAVWMPWAVIAQPGEDHFSIIDRFAEPTGALFQALADEVSASG